MATYTDISTEIIASIQKLYPEFTVQKAHIFYNGPIQQSNVKQFTNFAEVKLIEEERNTKKKIYHILVEFVQNVVKHSLESRLEGEIRVGEGLFTFWESNSDYYLLIGNNTDQASIEKITPALEYVNSLDKEGLKELYKIKMKESVLSEKGGAGLGFIDIAKKTGEKLNYLFLPSTPPYFILGIKISK